MLATQMLLCVTETFSDSFHHLGQVNRGDVKICFLTHTYPEMLLMVAAGVHGSDGSDGSLSRVP